MIDRPNLKQIFVVMLAGLFFLVPAMLSQVTPSDGVIMVSLILIIVFSIHAFGEVFVKLVPNCNLGYFLRYHALPRQMRTLASVKRGSSLSRPKAISLCLVLTLFILTPSVSAWDNGLIRQDFIITEQSGIARYWYPVVKNMTQLTCASSDEIRVMNGTCGAEDAVEYPIAVIESDCTLGDGSDWVELTIFANLTVISGDNDFCVYSNNGGASAPDYGLQLMGYYDFEEDGGISRDMSGSGYDAQENEISDVRPIFSATDGFNNSNAYLFTLNNSNDYPGSSRFNITGIGAPWRSALYEYNIMFWAWHNGAGGTKGIMAAQQADCYADDYIWAVAKNAAGPPDNMYFNGKMDGVSSWIYTNVSSASTWHHYSFQMPDETQTVFGVNPNWTAWLDGKSNQTTTLNRTYVDPVPASHDLSIGVGKRCSSGWGGYIDEVMLWNRTFTATEMLGFGADSKPFVTMGDIEYQYINVGWPEILAEYCRELTISAEVVTNRTHVENITSIIVGDCRELRILNGTCGTEATLMDQQVISSTSDSCEMMFHLGGGTKYAVYFNSTEINKNNTIRLFYDGYDTDTSGNYVNDIGTGEMVKTYSDGVMNYTRTGDTGDHGRLIAPYQCSDCIVEVDAVALSSKAGSNQYMFCGPVIRDTAVDDDFYGGGVYLHDSLGNGNELEIYSFDNWGAAGIIIDVPANGETGVWQNYHLKAVGTNISIYNNGTYRGSVINSDWSSGNISMVGYQTNCSYDNLAAWNITIGIGSVEYSMAQGDNITRSLNYSIWDDGVQVNFVGGDNDVTSNNVTVNITDILFGTVDNIRVAEGGCGFVAAAEVSRKVLSNGTDWANIQFNVNVNAGDNQGYCVYWNISGCVVPAPITYVDGISAESIFSYLETDKSSVITHTSSLIGTYLLFSANQSYLRIHRNATVYEAQLNITPSPWFNNATLDIGSDGSVEWSDLTNLTDPFTVIDFPGETNSTMVAEINSLLPDCSCLGCDIVGLGSAYCNITFDWTANESGMNITGSYFGYNLTGDGAAGVTLVRPTNGFINTTSQDIKLFFKVGYDDTCTVNVNGTANGTAFADGGYTLYLEVPDLVDGDYNWSVNCTEQGWSDTWDFTVDEYELQLYIQTLKAMYYIGEDISLLNTSQLNSTQSDIDLFYLYMYITNITDIVEAETYVDWASMHSISISQSPIELKDDWSNYIVPSNWLDRTMKAWVFIYDESNRSILSASYNFTIGGIVYPIGPADESTNATSNNITFVVNSTLVQNCTLNMAGEFFNHTKHVELVSGINNITSDFVFDDSYLWTLSNCTSVDMNDTWNVTVNEYALTFNIKTLNDTYIGGQTLGITDPPIGWPIIGTWQNDSYNLRKKLEICNTRDNVTHYSEVLGYQFPVNITDIVIHSDVKKELMIYDSLGVALRDFEVLKSGSDWASVILIQNQTLAVGECVNITVYFDNKTEVDRYQNDFFVLGDDIETFDDCDKKDNNPQYWRTKVTEAPTFSLESSDEGGCMGAFNATVGSTDDEYTVLNHTGQDNFVMLARRNRSSTSDYRVGYLGIGWGGDSVYNAGMSWNADGSSWGSSLDRTKTYQNNTMDARLIDGEWATFSLNRIRNTGINYYANGVWYLTNVEYNTTHWTMAYIDVFQYSQDNAIKFNFDDLVLLSQTQYNNLATRSYQWGNESFVTVGETESIPSWSYYHQAWSSRTNLTITNDNNFNYPGYVARANVTGLTLTNNCTHELRAVLNGNENNISIQTLRDGSGEPKGSQWCDVLFMLDLQANEDIVVSFYHGNSVVDLPNYPDNLTTSVYDSNIIEIHATYYDDFYFLMDGGSVLTYANGGGLPYKYNGSIVGGSYYIGIGIQGRNASGEWDGEMPFSGSERDLIGGPGGAFVNATCTQQGGPIAAYFECVDNTFNFTNEWILTNNTHFVTFWGGNNDHGYRVYHQNLPAWQTYTEDFSGVNQSCSSGLAELGADWFGGGDATINIVAAYNYSGNRSAPHIECDNWNTFFGVKSDGSDASFLMNSTEPFEYAFYYVDGSLTGITGYEKPRRFHEIYFGETLNYSLGELESTVPVEDQSRIDNTQTDSDDYTMHMYVTPVGDKTDIVYTAYENWTLRSITLASSPVKLDAYWVIWDLNLPTGVYNAWVDVYNNLNTTWGSNMSDNYSFTVSNNLTLIYPVEDQNVTDSNNFSFLFNSTYVNATNTCDVYMDGVLNTTTSAEVNSISNLSDYGYLLEGSHNWSVCCAAECSLNVTFTVNEYELTGSIQTLEQFYDLDDTVGITDPPDGGEGGDGLLHDNNSVTWRMTNSDLPPYGSVNGSCFRDNDGMKYCFDVENGYFEVFDYNDDFRRYMAFSITADQGEMSTDQYTWDLIGHPDDRYELYNNSAFFNWSMFFDFDPIEPLKITHNITQKVGITLTNSKMWYIFTVNPGEEAMYNGVNYSLDDDYNFTEGLNEIVPMIAFPESVFNFSDIIDDGFNITNLWVGDGVAWGYGGLRVLAIGFTAGNGEWPDGVTVTIDPVIIGFGDFNETLLDIVITPETSYGLNRNEIEITIANSLNQSLTFFRAELTDDPNMEFIGFFYDGLPLEDALEVPAEENRTISYKIEWMVGSYGKYNVTLRFRLENGTAYDALIDPFWNSTWRLAREVQINSTCGVNETDVLMEGLFVDDIYIWNNASRELRLINETCDVIGGSEMNLTVNSTDNRYWAAISFNVPEIDSGANLSWCLYYANESEVPDTDYTIAGGAESTCVNATALGGIVTQQSRIDSLQADDDCIWMDIIISNETGASTPIYTGYENWTGMNISSGDSPIKLDQYFVNWTNPSSRDNFMITLDVYACMTNESLLTASYDFQATGVLRLMYPVDTTINTTSSAPIFTVQSSDIYTGCTLWINNTQNVTGFSVTNGLNTITSAGNFSDGDYNWTVNCTGVDALQSFDLTIDEYDISLFIESNQTIYKPLQVHNITPVSNITNNQADNDLVYIHMYVTDDNDGDIVVHEAYSDWGSLYTLSPGITAVEALYAEYVLPGDNTGNYTVHLDLHDSMNNTISASTNGFNVFNEQPVMNNCTINPVPAYFNNMITCSCNYSDADNDSIVTTYVNWYINHSLKVEITNTSWSDAFNATELVGCGMIGFDGYSNSSEVISDMYIYNYVPTHLTYQNVTMNEDELVEYDFNCTDAEDHIINNTIWQTSWSAPVFP